MVDLNAAPSPDPAPTTFRFVSFVAAAGAVGGAFAGASPTGWGPADLMWSMALVAVISVACTQVPSAVLLLFGVATLGLSIGEPVAVALASTALVLGASTAVVDRAERSVPARSVVAAGAGACAANALLRLPDMGPTAMSALLVAVVVCPVLVVAWRATAIETRDRLGHWIRWGAIGFGAGIVVAALVGLGVRGSLEEGVAAAQSGAERARAGDVDAARAQFDRSAENMGTAAAWLNSPLMLPVRSLPFLGHQLHAVSVATRDAADLAGAGRDAIAVVADGGFEVQDGAVDLATVRAAIGPLEASVEALERTQRTLARLDSPWLVGPITERVDELSADIAENLPSAHRAVAGAHLAEGFLGSDGPRRYLVVFTTPAESRFMGGFVGHYARVLVDDGAIEIEASGHAADFHRWRERRGIELVGLDEHAERHANYSPEFFLENITATPDAPTAAEVARQILQRTTGDSIDVVVMMDPSAVAALATLNAPLDLDGVGELDQEGVSRFLLVDQYALFPDESDQRDMLDELISETLDGLLDGELNLGGMVERLGPLVEQGRLNVVSFDDDESAFLTDVGLTRPFIRPGPYDLLAVRSANATPNKLDVYLDRTIDYEVTLDPDDRTIEATTTITLDNTAPLDLPDVVAGGWDVPAPGTNRQYVSVYSDHQLESLTVNGEPVDPWIQTELGWNVSSVFVDILRGDEAVIEMRWSGRYRDDVDELVVSYQPTVVTDRVTARVVTTDGDVLVDFERGLRREARVPFRVG